MKKFIKKTLSTFFSVIGLSMCMSFSFCPCYAESKEAEETENFNFIKKDNDIEDFVYDGTVLLYGGIALVLVSISGMIFTFLPSKRKK